MPWLGAKVHGQVVLQRHVDMTKVVVDTHVGQRGYIGCRHRAHVDRKVVEHGPHRRQGKGWVHKGIGRHLWVQVLWNRPWQCVHSLHFLRWLL